MRFVFYDEEIVCSQHASSPDRGIGDLLFTGLGPTNTRILIKSILHNFFPKGRKCIVCLQLYYYIIKSSHDRTEFPFFSRQ